MVKEPDSSGWSAEQYNKTASFVYSPSYTAPILELLAARPSERIVDLGCGSGEVTLQIEKIVQSNNDQKGIVVGVDSSESMIGIAKNNGLRHAFVSDIQCLDIPDQVLSGIEGFNYPADKFDAAFTNAALHWCKRDPRGVLQGVKQVLKPGGRFVGELGGYLNVIGIKSCLHTVLRERGHDPTVLDPWYFPSPEEYAELLKSEGFQVQHISLTPRITPLDSDLLAWMNLFVRNSWLTGFSDEVAQEIMSQVQERCRIDCQDSSSGKWSMMYVRLRFQAVLSDQK